MMYNTKQPSNFDLALLKPLEKKQNEGLSVDNDQYITISAYFGDSRHKLEQLKEVGLVLRNLCHPNITNYKDWRTDHEVFYLIIEKPKGLPLSVLIREARENRAAIDSLFVLRIVREIGKVVLHMKYRNVAHRNLNTDDVFITENPFSIKIGGFDHARKINAFETDNSGKERNHFIAPEILYKGEITHKSDIWSLGLILYCLSTLKDPLDYFDETKNGCQNLPGDLRFLISRMVKHSPESRPNIEEILKDPIFDQIAPVKYPSPLPFTNKLAKTLKEEEKGLILPEIATEEMVKLIACLETEFLDWNKTVEITEPDADYVTATYFPDGSIYEGQIQGGNCQGRGVRVWPNQGKRYEGEWRGGKPHGFGRCINSKDGVVYEGQYHQGFMHGSGRLLIAGGNIYTGEFKEGKVHGRGVLQSADQTYYEGDFVAGLKEGYGVLCFKDSRKYQGQFKGGKQDGEGVLITPEGKIKAGIWKSGLYEDSQSGYPAE